MWWRKQTSVDAVLRAEVQHLAARMAAAVQDIERHIERIDQQVAALATTQGLRWMEGWATAEQAAPEGAPVLPRPLGAARGHGLPPG